MPAFSRTSFSNGNQVWSNSLGFPVLGPITQIFGQTSVTGSRHGGMDIAASFGTPVYAPASGIVTLNRWGDFGNWVVIDHGDGYHSCYAHLSSFGNFVSGMWIEQGDILGFIGSTGVSTGAHLHWAVSTNPNFALNFSELYDPFIFITEDENVSLEPRVSRLERLMGANGVAPGGVQSDPMGNTYPIGGLIIGEAAMQWMDSQGFSMHLGFASTEARIRALLSR